MGQVVDHHRWLGTLNFASLGRLHRVIRTKCPLSLEEAKRVVKQIVSDYNDRRLHSAIGYITPSDMLAGKQKAIHPKTAEANHGDTETRRKQTTGNFARRLVFAS